ncbi:MAG: NUDIX domain-containing protein [Candidatus Wildermuthbacteria bacterium]|nr:NUDIX domain-containing protein [Candidatus Wildermuthbacteria bacterium]
MPDDIWFLVQDSIVISCADALVIQVSPQAEAFILLGKRTYEPAKGLWWCIGGRKNPGESHEEGAARNVKRELGITIDPLRFKFLGSYSLVWAKRRHGPQEHGVHDDSNVSVVFLTDGEKGRITPNKEYSEVRWFSIQEILGQSSEFHPAIVKMCQDFLEKFGPARPPIR